MMIKKKFIMFFVLGSTVVFAQQNTLTVNITGINSIKGKVYVYLYTSEEGFPIEISKANSFKKEKVLSNSAKGFMAPPKYKDSKLYIDTSKAIEIELNGE